MKRFVLLLLLAAALAAMLVMSTVRASPGYEVHRFYETVVSFNASTYQSFSEIGPDFIGVYTVEEVLNMVGAEAQESQVVYVEYLFESEVSFENLRYTVGTLSLNDSVLVFNLTGYAGGGGLVPIVNISYSAVDNAIVRIVYIVRWEVSDCNYSMISTPYLLLCNATGCGAAFLGSAAFFVGECGGVCDGALPVIGEVVLRDVSSEVPNQNKLSIYLLEDLRAMPSGSKVYLAILSIDVLEPVEELPTNTVTVTYPFYVTETETVTNVTTLTPSPPGATDLFLLIAFGIMIGSMAFALLRR